MSRLSIEAAKGPLRGTLTVPGDKSITHRAFILGALAQGRTRITGYSHGEDCLNTLGVIQALGIEVQEISDGLEVRGQGLWGLREPSQVLDCGNSGTGLRLLAGVLAGQPFFSVLTGDDSLRSRPMGRVAKPLRQMGAVISGRQEGNLAPLGIQGGELKAIEYDSPVASAQIKSSVLLAGLFANGHTRVSEPMKSRDHTERLLSYFDLPVTVDGCTTALEGRCSFQGKPIAVPGDISAAAFFIVAASIVPDSEILLTGIGLNPERIGIVEILLAMGADITVLDQRDESGELVGDLRVRASPLRGVAIGPGLIPKTIDELPILCVAAAVAEGVTRITGAQELRVKETDRIHAMAVELANIGVQVEEQPDGLIIYGGGPFHGATCRSYGDHRVVMSLAIAGLLADTPVVIDDVQCVDTSFPGFHDKLLELLTNSRRSL